MTDIDVGLNQLRRLRWAFPDTSRVVVMSAIIVPRADAFLNTHSFAAQDPGASVAGGRVMTGVLEPDVAIGAGGAAPFQVVTWNTGEDLNRRREITHAEYQFVMFIEKSQIKPAAIVIELNYSPCPSCAGMLATLLRQWTEVTVTREPSRRMGNRVLVGSPVMTVRPPQAVLRWGRLYRTTTAQCLRDLAKAGWALQAPPGSDSRPEGSLPYIAPL